VIAGSEYTCARSETSHIRSILWQVMIWTELITQTSFIWGIWRQRDWVCTDYPRWKPPNSSKKPCYNSYSSCLSFPETVPLANWRSHRGDGERNDYFTRGKGSIQENNIPHL